MKSVTDIVEKINDRLNPIVVKELRQAVQGKFLIVVLICFLCLQLLIVGLFLTDEAVTESFNAGLNVFRVLLGDSVWDMPTVCTRLYRHPVGE